VSTGHIFLARHGRTALNASGTFQGRLDPPLDEVGREQARALAERAAALPVQRVVASPLRRARETAEALGRPVELDERWAEIDVGEWAGRSHAEIGLETLAAFRAGEVAPPRGESFGEVEARVLAAWDDLEPGTLVVSHGIAILLLLRALGDGPERLENCELVSVEHRPAGRP
jgi:glucosyl-3-phosphoglycerate phosphatase